MSTPAMFDSVKLFAEVTRKTKGTLAGKRLMPFKGNDNVAEEHEERPVVQARWMANMLGAEEVALRKVTHEPFRAS